MERTRKFEAIYAYAKCLVSLGSTKTFDELAIWLNQRGFTTSYGTPYQGGRGVARLVHAVYGYICSELELGETGAAPVAEAFTNSCGEFAYE